MLRSFIFALLCYTFRCATPCVLNYILNKKKKKKQQQQKKFYDTILVYTTGVEKKKKLRAVEKQKKNTNNIVKTFIKVIIMYLYRLWLVMIII